MASGNLRNEPCPCGSGLKYKKCCGSPAATAPPPMTLNDRIVDFALRVTPHNELQAAWEDFGESGRLERGDPKRRGLFLDFLITGRRKGGQTLLERFESERGPGLDEADKAELEKHKSTKAAVLEVLEVRKGVGFRGRDIFSGEELEVADVSSSRGAGQWDVMAVRMRRGDGPAQLWGEGVIFTPIEKAELKFDMEAAYGEAKVHEPGLSFQAFLNSATGLIRKVQAKYRSGRTVSANVEEIGPLPKGLSPDAVLAVMALQRGARWPDEPVPALGNRTPRQAAGDAEGRGFLAVLLKEYEANEGKRAGRSGVERLVNVPAVVWMRQALGLEVGPELERALKKLERAASPG